MTNIIAWVGKNKLSVVLLVVVGYLLLQSGVVSQLSGRQVMMNSKSAIGSNYGGVMMDSLSTSVGGYSESMPYNAPAPVASSNRMVVQDTNISLLVKDVSDSINKIETTSESLGGYMVNSYLSTPEGAASGSITVRVPSTKRAEALAQFKALGVKVVSENVSGRDVTDQYTNLDARLEVLNKTKSKFEQIMDQAVSVSDLLTVQRELVNMQSQIDSVIGQQRYLEQTAKLTLVSISLSTDELALPYAPDAAWRPAVVFKEAVRSMIATVRSLGNTLIWLAVYSPVWGVALVGYLVVRRRNKARLVVTQTGGGQ